MWRCSRVRCVVAITFCTTTLSGYGFDTTGLVQTTSPGWTTFVLVWDASVQHCDARGSPSKLTYVAADTPDRALCFDGTQGAAVCQSCSSDYNCGLTSTAVWSLLNTLNPCSGLVYTVTGGTRARTSIISLTCDMTVAGLTFTSSSENPGLTCVCRNAKSELFVCARMYV